MLHRPPNVDDAEILDRILGVLAQLSSKIPSFSPIHLRTKRQIGKLDLDRYFILDI